LFGLHAKLLSDREQVRLMTFEESKGGHEKCRAGGAAAQLVSPDSGQIEKALRPPLVAERCRERRQRKRDRIMIVIVAQHGLSDYKSSRGSELAKIMIVEDNALNIKLFCDLLAAHGHQPEAVTDSRLALDAARAFLPDLVITDIQLPHVSGLDLIRMIRSDKQLREVPIMAVTAYSAQGDEERIRGAGAQAYVSKPISVAKFAQTVEELLARPSSDGESPDNSASENNGGDADGPQEASAEEKMDPGSSPG
jgi:two-component system cell cycle response regulator DivK